MVSLVSTLAALAMALLSTTGAEGPLAIRNPGFSCNVTSFNPGLGACGETNGDDDAIVAVSAAVFDDQRSCNRMIRVWYNDKSVDVRVVDRCASCTGDDLDLSPSAFNMLVGHMDQGRAPGDWDWV